MRPVKCVCVEDKDISLSLSLHQHQTGLSLPLISILVTAVFRLASLSLDTGHCSSPFMSRLVSNLSSHLSETHSFPSFHLSNFVSLAFNLLLRRSSRVVGAFHFRIVRLLHISAATVSGELLSLVSLRLSSAASICSSTRLLSPVFHRLL